jgi:hypothetical protein
MVFATALAASLALIAPAAGAAQQERDGNAQGRAHARSQPDAQRPQPQARQSEPQRSAPPARQPQRAEPTPRTAPDRPVRQTPAPVRDREVRPSTGAPTRPVPDARYRQTDPRQGTNDNRYRSNDPRYGSNNSRYRQGQNFPVGRAVPRFDGRWNGRPPSIIVSRPVHVYQPYYAFRPRTSFSFGLSIGYPVAFPGWYDPFRYDGYYYPGYRSPYPSGSYRTVYGGFSFDIQPLDADIYVDGDYVGTAGEFDPYDAPLTLAAGLHRVEIDARGCRPVSFDLTVLGGQVIPYRGSLGCD